MKLPKPINKVVTLVANSVSQTSGKDIDKSFSMAEGIDAVSRQAAAESIVLLENNGILPFSKDVKKVALIGPLADEKNIVGSWWCAYDKNETVTVREGLEKLLPDAEIKYAKGCELTLDATDLSGIPDAVEAAKASDVLSAFIQAVNVCTVSAMLLRSAAERSSSPCATVTTPPQ